MPSRFNIVRQKKHGQTLILAAVTVNYATNSFEFSSWPSQNPQGEHPAQTNYECHRSPTYELSKYLANILSPLQKNKYTIKNIASFVAKIRTMSVDPDGSLVSFDVVSLFTCIPTHLAIEVVKERLDFDRAENNKTSSGKKSKRTKDANFESATRKNSPRLP